MQQSNEIDKLISRINALTQEEIRITTQIQMLQDEAKKVLQQLSEKYDITSLEQIEQLIAQKEKEYSTLYEEIVSKLAQIENALKQIDQEGVK